MKLGHLGGFIICFLSISCQLAMPMTYRCLRDESKRSVEIAKSIHINSYQGMPIKDFEKQIPLLPLGNDAAMKKMESSGQVKYVLYILSCPDYVYTFINGELEKEEYLQFEAGLWNYVDIFTGQWRSANVGP